MGADPRGLGRGVPDARARGDRRVVGGRADACGGRRNGPLFPGCARRARRSACPGASATRAVGAGVRRAAEQRRLMPCWPSAIPELRPRFTPTTAGGWCAHSSSRMSVARSMAIVCGPRRQGIRPSSWVSTSRRRSSIVGSSRERARCSRQASRRRFGSRSRNRSRPPRGRSWGYARSRSFRGLEPSRHSPPERGGWPPTSGSGCGGSRASLPWRLTGPPTRWLMTFSRWRAVGNEYLLVERAELPGPLTPDDVRAHVDGADGILEVVAITAAEAEIVIWNPDGSTAEMSGNGTRIAARWLADRVGTDSVVIRVGARAVSRPDAPGRLGRAGHRRGRRLRA